MILILPFSPEKIALQDFSTVSRMYITVSVCFWLVVCFVYCTIEGDFQEKNGWQLSKDFGV